MLDLTILGWKIWYAGGTTYSSRDGLWTQAPATGVQVVTVYYAATYQIVRAGGPATENYVQQFFTARAGSARSGERPTRRDEPVDYFWYDPATLTYGAGGLADVPGGLPIESVKTGSLLPDEDFFAIYNVAKEDRTAP